MANYITLHDLVKKKTWHESWREKTKEYSSAIERNFLFGNAWTKEEHDEMKAKGEPSFKANRITPVVDNYKQTFKTVSGLEIINPEAQSILYYEI